MVSRSWRLLSLVVKSMVSTEPSENVVVATMEEEDVLVASDVYVIVVFFVQVPVVFVYMSQLSALLSVVFM